MNKNYYIVTVVEHGPINRPLFTVHTITLTANKIINDSDAEKAFNESYEICNYCAKKRYNKKAVAIRSLTTINNTLEEAYEKAENLRFQIANKLFD